MQRFYAILILIFISSSCLLMSGISYFQIKKTKRYIKLLLAENKIDYCKTLIFYPHQLDDAVWVEPREFRLQNNMYDVFKTDTMDGMPVYHCFLDKDESVWVELLLSANQSSNPANPDASKLPLRYLMKDIIKFSPTKVLPSLSFITIDKTFYYIFYYHFQAISSHFQPPEK